ncbi:hypothetical protein GWO43_05070 [candidate division KSB1 bacterium]|nr:hypothetical protein [candidate division KSB1 bacterium]NIU23990.1 hypothetical protein [candidate division KSB1 bacterium]NIU92590.1 hypothetical protein [candidate division KSB1 bacterium]NIV95144.1 hypothetical protein [candidate division KSB1 bacterium]NIW68359.1 hypothetical protein [candidate division KSB1 bacterium]
MVKFAPKPKGLQKATAQAVVEQTSLETIHDVVEAHRFCISSIPAGSAIETVISKLETNASVQAAFPARVDQAGNTRYFILDEFTVPFKENMSIRKRCSQIVKSHNCEVVKDHLTPGYYTLSVPSCNGMFEMVVFS